MSKEGYAQITTTEDDEEELPRISGGEAGASAFSRMVFQWVDPAVWEGSKLDHIEAEQLWERAQAIQTWLEGQGGVARLEHLYYLPVFSTRRGIRRDSTQSGSF